MDRTNALRRENGVAVLRVNDRLMQAAQVRADEMAASGIYSHTRPDGRKSNTVTDSKYTGKTFTTSRSCILSSSTKRSLKRWPSCGPTPRPMRTT